MKELKKFFGARSVRCRNEIERDMCCDIYAVTNDSDLKYFTYVEGEVDIKSYKKMENLIKEIESLKRVAANFKLKLNVCVYIKMYFSSKNIERQKERLISYCNEKGYKISNMERNYKKIK